ncbi:hypothetical protein Q5Y75_18855 [Ruegeria sp. 2205SS24-7]|uniref:hypothetical protein n=1 Tax=Ruegeria discodermiae TaxID=3064389 RepID=UPI0027409F49|nr:hypothetical protein [Ruegeria sp. 2205SS24-7]MDP5219286.1 hypothetical protein [Ruegeria sp. 2205SS24-7]
MISLVVKGSIPLMFGAAASVYAADPFSSEFERFSRETVWQLQADGQPVATSEVLGFLSEAGIEDRVSFLQSNMDAWAPYHVDDPELSSNIRSALVDQDTQVLRVYSDYHYGLFDGGHELRVLMWEKADGDAELAAYVVDHSL